MEESCLTSGNFTAVEIAFESFLRRYPFYEATSQVDHIRQREYSHLDDDENSQVYFDYTGVGLFSRSEQLGNASSFGLAYISANLATHAMYAEEDGTLGSIMRRRILQYLNVDEEDYAMVFTANTFSALKLLGESYPFHLSNNLLLGYDHQNEGLDWFKECAGLKGASVSESHLIWPSLQLEASDLRKKMRGRSKKGTFHSVKKRVKERGLFAYPIISHLTGVRNSPRWISEAQENGWHVLLDISGLGVKALDSLSLKILKPEFILSSFYKVFGSDPTGFACLVIKKSVLCTLGDSSRARAVGMVGIVSRLDFPHSPSESPDFTTSVVPSSSAGWDSNVSAFGCSLPDCPWLMHASAEEKSMKGSTSCEHQQINNVCHEQPIKKTLKSRVQMEENQDMEAHGERSRLAGTDSACENSMEYEALQYSSHDMKRMNLKGGLRQESEIHGLATSQFREKVGDRMKSRKGNELDTSEGPGRMKFTHRSFSNQDEHFPLNDTRGRTFNDIGVQTRVSEDPSSEEWFLHWRQCLLQYCGHQLGRGASFNSLREKGLRSSSFSFRRRKKSRSFGVEETDYEGRLPHKSTLHIRNPYSVSAPCTPGFSDSDDEPSGRSLGSKHVLCRGLDQVDQIGPYQISLRVRALVNWLVSSLLQLRYPDDGHKNLVKIYGPLCQANRGSTVAFNILNSSGQVIDLKLVQRLADRSNISLGTGVVKGTFTLDEEEREEFLVESKRKVDTGSSQGCVDLAGWSGKGIVALPKQFPVLCAALGLLSNFTDVLKLVVFVAHFLESDFVSRELWHYQYTFLNQETVLM